MANGTIFMNGIKYSGGGSSGGSGGTSDYNDLNNKPKINGIELNGNQTTSDLNINSNNIYMDELKIETLSSYMYNNYDTPITELYGRVITLEETVGQVNALLEGAL